MTAQSYFIHPRYAAGYRGQPPIELKLDADGQALAWLIRQTLKARALAQSARQERRT